MNDNFILERLDNLESRLIHIEKQVDRFNKWKTDEKQKLEKRFFTIEHRLFHAKRMLTLIEAAEYLGCSKSQLYKLTSNKIIPHFKPTGKTVYFEVKELNDWIKQYHILAEKECIEELKNLKF